MKVLLTSGGTRCNIDEVRILTNLSSGTFGNHICKAFLEAGLDVTFLYAKGSKCPHELRVDLLKTHMVHVEGPPYWARRYSPVEYHDFDDYAAKLFRLIGSVRPDIVVLAAAVSDYAPVKQEGKISSELDEMTIRLVKTPKLIRKVRDVLPDCFLVGFKLLVGSTQFQLDEAMGQQKAKARCDMVVGNDLRDIRAAQHRLSILSIDGEGTELGPCPGDELAKQLVEEIVRDARTMNGDFNHIGAGPGRKGAKAGTGRTPVPKFCLQPTPGFPDGAPQREEYDDDAAFQAACDKYDAEWLVTYSCSDAECMNQDCPQHGTFQKNGPKTQRKT